MLNKIASLLVLIGFGLYGCAENTPEELAAEAAAAERARITAANVAALDQVVIPRFRVFGLSNKEIAETLNSVLSDSGAVVSSFEVDDAVNVQIEVSAATDRQEIADNAVRWLVGAGSDTGKPGSIIGQTNYEYKVVIGSGDDYLACVKSSFGTTIKCF